MTIDRIIFADGGDSGIEEYGRLMALGNGGDVYDRLRVLFGKRRALQLRPVPLQPGAGPLRPARRPHPRTPD
ncbi:MAG: hypothetical protein WKH64_19020 [Chloroflexia bacterium]